MVCNSRKLTLQFCIPLVTDAKRENSGRTVHVSIAGHDVKGVPRPIKVD